MRQLVPQHPVSEVVTLLYSETIGEKPSGIVVNEVPTEVPRPKPEGPQALRVLALRLSEGLHFPMIHPRLFHRFSFFWHTELE